ncbi:zinc-binding alcohol dehydrogenase family protein [Fictibacillus aquaticus]|uniref:Quinone oxidoreductase n=1 Tax=Fictibacillus aquaticus TaxID=2021314 RepID=A0A235F9C7_9BACL|nr:NADPH:quinone oxidoreductase family protein [Fictibacillus aquaticus]OYD57315.1 quinone oxidoreductase [Fictibacillus aquaticus]
MKAILVKNLGGSENMIVADVPVPDPDYKQVLIRVHTTSVNFADIKSRYGKKGNVELPYIPGMEAAGVIEKVGPGVENLKPGQRVIAFTSGGSYAEYALASEKLTFVLPDGIALETAAACPIVSFTSFNLLSKVARLQPSETVLIHAAAGGIGTTAIQLAKLLGAGTVIGTVSRPHKKLTVTDAGADHVICTLDEDFAEAVNELTDGRGADVILDSVSGKVFENSLKCLAPFGRLVHFGNAGGEAGTVVSADLHSSCRSVLGFSFGTTRAKRPELLQETAEHVFRYLANGSLKIKVGREYPLSEAAAAHDWVESRQSTGKVLLRVER